MPLTRNRLRNAIIGIGMWLYTLGVALGFALAMGVATCFGHLGGLGIDTPGWHSEENPGLCLQNRYIDRTDDYLQMTVIFIALFALVSIAFWIVVAISDLWNRRRAQNLNSSDTKTGP